MRPVGSSIFQAAALTRLAPGRVDSDTRAHNSQGPWPFPCVVSSQHAPGELGVQLEESTGVAKSGWQTCPRTRTQKLPV